jgi:SAM-dependent methyltransferase
MTSIDAGGTTRPTAAQTAQTLALQVRENYARSAIAVLQGTGHASCCDDGCPGGTSAAAEDDAGGSALYDEDQKAQLPAAALQASLGCGNPTAVADLKPGDVVLDLGSGGGIDVLLSARRVAPGGKAYGVDAVPEMLELARRNAASAEVSNVEFLSGEIENIPLPDAVIDVVISNCVINLSVDKPAVFASAFRVLKPGGRFGVSDVVAGDELTAPQRAERGDWVGCIAGALSVSEYRRHLQDAGFTDIDISLTREVADGMHSAIVRATKPNPL